MVLVGVGAASADAARRERRLALATDDRGAAFHGARSIVTAVTVVLATALGAWIYYNTNVLTRYETAEDRDVLQADYEKRYKTYEQLPMPEAVSLGTTVDIYPSEQRVESRGVAVHRMCLPRNRSPRSI
jgi:hypothetical protein